MVNSSSYRYNGVKKFWPSIKGERSGPVSGHTFLFVHSCMFELLGGYTCTSLQNYLNQNVNLLVLNPLQLQLNISNCVGGCRHSPNSKLTAIRNVLVDSRVFSLPCTCAHLLLWRHRAVLIDSLRHIRSLRSHWQVRVDWQLFLFAGGIFFWSLASFGQFGPPLCTKFQQ